MTPFTAPAISHLMTSKGWAVVYPQIAASRINLPSDSMAAQIFCTEQGDHEIVLDQVAAHVQMVDTLFNNMPMLDRRPVLAGHSRGGILALLVAAELQSIRGVVNFSGGWLGGGCRNSDPLNEQLFSAAGRYPGISLWIYGEDDITFDIAYTAHMLMAYTRAGGRAILHTKTIGDESGHNIFNLSRYWSEILSVYLTEFTGLR